MAVIVPVKPLGDAKRRLAEVLDPAGRTLLAAWMLERVLAAAAVAAVGGERYVVGGDKETSAIARRHGAVTLPELGRGLNETLARAMRAAGSGERCLVLPGDLPRLTPADVEALWGAAEGEGGAALAPDHTGTGTNGLVVPAGCPFSPSFGPGSRVRHRAQFEQAGCAPREVTTPGLAYDVDTPEDLVDLLTAVPECPVRPVPQGP